MYVAPLEAMKMNPRCFVLQSIAALIYVTNNNAFKPRWALSDKLKWIMFIINPYTVGAVGSKLGSNTITSKRLV